jgi:translation initiation factor eIF-2B subunit epsilon
MARGAAKAGGKKAKGSASGAGGGEDTRREAPLQAVLFADSFSETFRPITRELPKVLLPLANVPMLEYSLELLASSGVAEVVLFCTHHAEAVEQFVRERSRAATRLQVRCVSSPTCLTAGDALREIDRLQLVQSNPFILMSGDVVANVDLVAAVAEHKARKKSDPNCIMTSLFKELPPAFANPAMQRASGNASVRALGDELVVGIDAQTSQIVLYEDDPQKRSTRLATVFLEDHAQLSLRADLLDCYIDICSPEVLLKFAEDFDYQDLRRDFFHNEVQNYELGKKFFARVVTDEFAARVMDPRTYAGVSRAILQRWVFPMVPDANYLGEFPSDYAYLRGMRYKDANVTLSRTSKFGRESILGNGTNVGDGAVIELSAIGRGCVIGKNARVAGSFLWSNVVVEDGAVVENAILCDNVVVRRGARISEGCVLSFGVVIGEGFTLAPFSKVTTSVTVEEDDGFSSDEDEDDDESAAGASSSKKEAASSTEKRVDGEWDSKQVGVGGVGRLWTLDDDGIEAESDSEAEEDDKELDEEEEERRITHNRLEQLKKRSMGARDTVKQAASRWEEWETLSSSESEGGDDEDERLAAQLASLAEPSFHDIIRENVITGDAAGHNVDDLFMEIKSFKFAQNKSFTDVIDAVLPGLLDRIPTSDGQSAVEVLKAAQVKLDKWAGVIEKCLVEREDQSAVVQTLASYCSAEDHTAPWRALFRFLLQTVYDLEWVEEEVILEWHAAAVADEEDAGHALASGKDVSDFIEWLQQSEDEESDDDDEESDAESEDE